MRLLLTALKRCNDLITRLIKVIVVVMVIVMVCAIIWQITMRYIFNSPPSWTEELALLLFSWSMLLMLAVGVRESFHVRMDVLVLLLPKAGNRALQMLIDIAIAGFGAYLVWAGIDYAVGMYGATSAAIAYPIVLLYSAAPVSGALIFIYSLELLLARHVAGDNP
ncbi:MAG: TRAP transporter small permease [Burkholderiaceae bacterium]